MNKQVTSNDSEIPTVEARNGRFKKGVSGNPKDRPPGSRNKATLAMMEFLEGQGLSGGHRNLGHLHLAGGSEDLARLCRRLFADVVSVWFWGR